VTNRQLDRRRQTTHYYCMYAMRSVLNPGLASVSPEFIEEYKPQRSLEPCRLDFDTPLFSITVLSLGLYTVLLFHNHRSFAIPTRGYHLLTLPWLLYTSFRPFFSLSIFRPSPPYLHLPLSPLRLYYITSGSAARPVLVSGASRSALASYIAKLRC